MKLYKPRPIVALLTSLALLMCVPLAGCFGGKEPVQVVQDVVTALNNSLPYIGQAPALAADLRVLDPQIADAVQAFAPIVKANVENAIKIGNDYIARPSGDVYQQLLNAADALVAQVDNQVLQAARITNPLSQQKVLVFLGFIATGLHIVLGLLKQYASKSQIRNMPKTAHVDFDRVKPYLNRDYATQQLAAMHYDAGRVLQAYGM